MMRSSACTCVTPQPLGMLGDKFKPVQLAIMHNWLSDTSVRSQGSQLKMRELHADCQGVCDCCQLEPWELQAHGSGLVLSMTAPPESSQELVQSGIDSTLYALTSACWKQSCTTWSLTCRGKFRSKPWQQLLDEAKFLVESGVKELNLIAEDTNQYGQDRRDGKGLAQLMHELGKLEGLQWMRILYAYPSYFTDDLIDEIANNRKVCMLCLYMHLLHGIVVGNVQDCVDTQPILDL